MTPPPTPETLDRVIGLVALYGAPHVIGAHTRLAADLALDWLDRVGIGCDLAAVFEIDVPDAEIADWDTVEDIARTVQQHVGTAL
jgi:acyl carrier protein